MKNTRVIPIGRLMEEDSQYQDDQIVSVAGIVQTIKMKPTRNNSMMAYVTVEDDTASVEMIAFSSTLNQYGGYLRENLPVVITGKLSLRDDKEPQILINRARPLSDFTEEKNLPQPQNGTLYLRLPDEAEPLFGKVRAILNMFPGENPAVLYFEDTKQRRGTRCALDQRMLSELQDLLGGANVVVK